MYSFKGMKTEWFNGMWHQFPSNEWLNIILLIIKPLYIHKAA